MNNIKKLGVFKDFADGSLKSVFANNGNIIEMTLLFNKIDRDVVCVPTHYFCNLGCKMCHLTNVSVKRPMIPITVDDFIPCLINTLTKNNRRITDKKKLLISFMGVGEPLLNFNLIKEVYAREELIKKQFGYDAIGYSLSTMMPNDSLITLTEKIISVGLPLKVHFSLHTPIDVHRFGLLPSTRVHVVDALKMLVTYSRVAQNNSMFMDKYRQLHSNGAPVEIHYTLIDGVNDSDKELEYLCKLLKEYPIPIKFIRFNPINNLVQSLNETKWVNEINKNIPGLRVKIYSPPGREIGSSCGEFTKHYYHAEIETDEERCEFERWKRKHQVE